jgi:hypothetical protein
LKIFPFDEYLHCNQPVAIENFPSHKISWNYTSTFVDTVVDVILTALETTESVFMPKLVAKKISAFSELTLFQPPKQSADNLNVRKMESIVQWFLFFFPDNSDTPPMLCLLVCFDVTDTESTSFLQSLCTIPINQRNDEENVSIDDYSPSALCQLALRQSMVVFPDPVIACPHQFFSAFSMIRSLILLRRTHYDQYEILADCVASDMTQLICEDETLARAIVSTASIPFFQIPAGSVGINPRYRGLLVPQASLYPYPNFWNDFQGKLELAPAVKNFFSLVQHQCNNDLEYLLDAFVPHLAV